MPRIWPAQVLPSREPHASEPTHSAVTVAATTLPQPPRTTTLQEHNMTISPVSTIHTALDAAGLDVEPTCLHIAAALDEDLAWGPVATTLATIGADVTGTAEIVAREPGCLAGVPVAALALQITAERDGVDLDIEILREDGATVAAGDPILRATGPVDRKSTRLNSSHVAIS